MHSERRPGTASQRVEPRVFDGFAQLRLTGTRFIMNDDSPRRIQRHFYPFDARQGLQYIRYIIDAALTMHTADTNHRLLCRHFLLLRKKFREIRARDHAPSRSGRQRRSSSEFETTETELIAIAAPAMTGLSIPSAASGIVVSGKRAESLNVSEYHVPTSQ